MFRGVAWLGLVLVVGVTSRRPGPIITVEQQQRICADLCSAGLGGAPCGAVCFDLMPSGIPLQSRNDTDAVDAVDASPPDNTRSSACPVLCDNHLGYPLCQCEHQDRPHAAVNFVQICEHYCQHEDWVVRGCPVCTNTAAKQYGPQALFKQDGVASKMVQVVGATSFKAVPGRKVDWGQWCQDQCSQGNGGSACNCDILPFSLN